MTMFGYNILGFGSTLANAGAAGGFFATGGNTITGAGLDIVHTFTASGTFAVVAGETAVSYLVIAGGGGGGKQLGGGGGAGGYRASFNSEASGGGGSAETALTLGTSSNTVTIGAGGAGATATSATGVSGANSVFSSITSVGGGGGGSYTDPRAAGLSGGSAAADAGDNSD